MRKGWVAGLLVVLAAGCGNGGATKGGGGSGAGGGLVGAGNQWVQVETAPDWVKTPPPREGFFRFVLVRRSNLVALATDRNAQLAPGDAERRIAALLAGTVDGKTAAAVAAAAAKTMAAVAHVVKVTPSPRGKEEIPGSSLAEAWCLWEAPLEGLLAPVAAERREAVSKKLETAVSFD